MKSTLNQFRTILAGIILFSAFPSHAQTIDPSNPQEEELLEYCATHKKMNELLSNPEFAAQYALDQAKMAQAEQQMRDNPPQRVIYKIPVVFHILHNNGVENISNAQVMDALEHLNKDYRMQNPDVLDVHNDFKASNPNATCTPADIEIEFVLATKAPDGTCFNGITRTQSTYANTITSGTLQVNTIIAGNDVYKGQWPGNKYLNVFICPNIGGMGGYTYNPSSSNASSMNNGVWIVHIYLGSIGTAPTDRNVLTHEVGHWLNLHHTWGPTNAPEVACGSDEVADTPETRGHTSCNLNESFCGPRANVENYMEYSSCTKMFSEGQKARMRAALLVFQTGRRNLWSASNLTEVGADGDNAGEIQLCNATFTASKQIVCPGEAIQFTDNSYHAVTGWTWSFPGGIPATSTEQNPSVIYNTPGTYAVTLTATDGTNTDIETKTGFITVLPAGLTLPYFEGFEAYEQTFDITNFTIVSSSINAKWALTTDVGSSGSKSIKLNNFDQVGINADELISKPINLSAITNAQGGVTLSFRYAYRKKATANNESLKVFLTKDCGDTWEQRKTISGASLSSLTSTTAWTPTTPEDWTTVHVTNVTSQFWVNNFAFKFRFEGNGGNNIYLDDINIYRGGPINGVGLDENKLSSINDLSVFPNPAENELNVSFNMDNSKAMNLVVTDLLGKIIQTQNIQAAAGSNLVLISTENLASGMYLLQVGGEESKQTVQFLVK